MPATVTVNDLLDGHVALDVECLDRIYLNGYVPNGMALPEALELRRRDPQAYQERSLDSIARHVEGMVAAFERAWTRDQCKGQRIAEARGADGDDRIRGGLDIHGAGPCAGGTEGSTEASLPATYVARTARSSPSVISTASVSAIERERRLRKAKSGVAFGSSTTMSAS